MIYRPFGTTGIEVSQVGLGTWPLAGNQGLQGYGARDEGLAEATMRRALAGGITIFDTADVYGGGYAEELLGRLATGGHGEGQTLVVTKGGLLPSSGGFEHDPESLVRRAEASAQRLRRRPIDVYLLHNPPAYLLGIADTYRPLRRLQREGVVRWCGVSVSRTEEAWLVLDRPEVDVIELPFSLVDMTADLGLLAEAAGRGKAVIVREALCHGLLSEEKLLGGSFEEDDFRSSIPAPVLGQVHASLTAWAPYRRPGEGWVDFALRFVLDRPEVSAVVVGARRPEHVDTLLRAGSRDDRHHGGSGARRSEIRSRPPGREARTTKGQSLPETP